jgi:hypothetical protein
MTSKLNPISVLVAELEAIAKWTSTKDGERQFLNLVAFRNDEYVACDGHRLVRAPVATHGHEFGIERTHVMVAVAAHRAMGHKRRHIDLLPGTNMVAAVHIGPEVAPAAVRLLLPMRDLKTAGYPSVSALDAQMSGRGDTPIEGYAFNPDLMAAIAEVHRADSDTDTSRVPVCIQSWSHDKLGGLVITTPKGIRFVVMPIRPQDR